MAVYPAPIQVQRKRGPGCVGCGCLLIGALVLLLVALAAFTAWRFYHVARDYTGTSSAPVPQFDGGDAVYNDAQQRLQTFQQAIQSGQPASLHLTADQINTLIARNPSFEKLRNHLFFSASGSEAQIQFSTPLASLEKSVFPDRFLNGDATFGLSFNSSGHLLNFDLHAIHLAGRDLPNGFEDGFNDMFNTTFNQWLQGNSAVRDFLNHVQKLTIENGELVLETN